MKKLLLLATCLFFTTGCQDTPSSQLKEGSICSLSKIEIAVDETYNVFMMLNDEFKDETLTLELSNQDIILMDADLGIIQGKKLGETTLTIKSSEYFQKIPISVLSDEYMNEHFVVDKGRLFQKTAVFYGDSITDSHPSRRPGYEQYQNLSYYPEIIHQEAMLKDHFNLSYSGATAAYCPSIVNIGGPTVLGFNQVKNSQEEAAKSDYAFILIGTNDFMRCVPLGTIEDDPQVFEDATTFTGSLNYMYKTLLSYNPKIRIVAILIPFATWGQDTNAAYAPGYGTSRDEYNAKILEIVEKYHFISIPTMDLWDATNWQQYIYDGIHPIKLGHEALAKRILNEI